MRQAVVCFSGDGLAQKRKGSSGNRLSGINEAHTGVRQRLQPLPQQWKMRTGQHDRVDRLALRLTEQGIQFMPEIIIADRLTGSLTLCQFDKLHTAMR